MKKKPFELSYDDLRFDFNALLESQPPAQIPDIIGQPRAIKALSLGTAIKAPGYNIFVTGHPGTGRMTAVKKILSQQKPNPHLTDLVYVFNFAKPEAPQVLSLPQGKAVLFKAMIHDLVEALKAGIKRELAGDLFKSQRDTLLKQTEFQENHLLAEFESKVNKDGFKIIQNDEEDEASGSTDIMPVFQGEIVSFEDLQGKIAEGLITEEFWNQTREKYYIYIDEMKGIFDQLRSARLTMEQSLRKLQVATVKKLIHTQALKISRKFPAQAVKTYLNDFEKDVETNLFLFTSEKPLEDGSGNPAFIRYGVNVLVDRGNAPVLPIVYETRPTPANLFGTVETRVEPTGESRTNFMMIRAGALMQASGGYLVLKAEDVLSNEESWPLLKQALENRRSEIQVGQSPFGGPAASMKPTPVEIDVKVILVGAENLYDYFSSEDRDFSKLFKISAEFDSVMDRTPHTTWEYLRFIDGVVTKNHLLPVDNSGKAELLEFGIRLAEHRNKLSTRFSAIADMVYESNHWALEMGLNQITREAVTRAQDERNYLFSLPEEKMDEQVAEGQILLDTRGSAVGQVNGLAILDRGSYSFGRPMRITASAAPGDDGIVNIEGEAGLSGEIHDKGVLILRGLIRTRFAQEFPLNLAAGICFEQSYGGVDGDSASSTEAYALLSAVSGIPLRQDLAVSGSINQMGEIQPVGGITEKVEGFYSTCKKQGLTGTQGVIVPFWNIQNLVLRKEVQEAVKAGRFHIYPVKTLEEGLLLLTGMEVGEINDKGHYPTGTLGHLIVKRLHKMRDLLQEKD